MPNIPPVPVNEDSSIQLPIGINEYLRRLRDTLLDKYRTMSDVDLMMLAVKARPDLKNVQFTPEYLKPTSFEAIGTELYSFAERMATLPLAALTTGYNVIESAYNISPLARKYGKMPKYNTAFYSMLYSLARDSVDKARDDISFVRNTNLWYSQNPFEYNKMFDSPYFAKAATNLLTSWAPTIAAGAAFGPVGGIAVATLLEGGDAFQQAYDYAASKGLSNDEIINNASSAMALYGPAAGIMESIVPLSILSTLGFFSRKAAPSLIKKFSSNFVKLSANKSLNAYEKAASSMAKLASFNSGILNRILTIGKSIGLNQITEASTEGTQFLLQEAIVEGLSGEDITVNWIGDKLRSPGFKESVAFGAMGGNIAGTVSGIAKSSGRKGVVVADVLKKFHTETNNNVLLHHMVNGIIDSNDLDISEKIKFAKVMKKYYEINKIGMPISEPTKPPEPGPKPPPKKPAPMGPAIKPTEPAPTTPATAINIYWGAGENKVLSNLAPRPFTFEERDYRSVEHAYQSLKSGKFDSDAYERGKTANKAIGQLGTNRSTNMQLMKNLIAASFEQNPQAAKKLLATGNAQLTHTQDKGIWRQMFPKLLMEVREELRKEEKPATPATVPPGAGKIKFKPTLATPESEGAVTDFEEPSGEPAAGSEEPGEISGEPEEGAVGILTNIIHEDKYGKVTSVAGKTPSEKVFGLFISKNKQIVSSIKNEFDTMPAGDKNLVLSLLGYQIETLTKGKALLIKNESGAYNSKKIFSVIDYLQKKGAIVSSEKKSTLAGAEVKTELKISAQKKSSRGQSVKDIGKIIDSSKTIGMTPEQIDALIVGKLESLPSPEGMDVHTPMEQKPTLKGGKKIAKPTLGKEKLTKKGESFLSGNIQGDFQEDISAGYGRGPVNPIAIARAYARLKAHYPGVKVQSVDRIVTRWGTEAVGRAVGSLVNVVENKARESTLPHEYAHIYIDIFGDDPIVGKALKTILSVDDIPMFNKATKSEDAIAFGVSATGNPVIIKELKQRMLEYRNQFYKYKNKNIDLAMIPLHISSMYREAHEAATGTGSGGYAAKDENIYNDSKYHRYSHEKLAQLIGDYYTNRITDKSKYNKIKLWIKHFINKIKKVFGLLSDSDAPYFVAEEFYRGERAQEFNDRLETRENPDTFEWYDDSNEEYVDDEEDLEPGTFVNRYFENTFGVYLGKDGYNDLAKVAIKYKDKSFLDEHNFNSYKMELIQKVEEITGTNFGIKFWESGRGFNKKIKKFYQKANSSIVVGMKSGNRIMYEIVVNADTKEITEIRPVSAINPVTNKFNPSTAVSNFIEEDNLLHGTKNALIYIPYNMIFTNQKGINFITNEAYSNFRQASPDFDFSINETSLNNLSRKFYNEFIKGNINRLLYFYAETGGDNKHLMFSAVPDHLLGNSGKGMTREEFIEFLSVELKTKTSYNDNIITKDQANTMVSEGTKLYERNHGIYSQLAAYHVKQKSIKGNYYLANQKGVSVEYRRLKLDISPSWVPRGIGDSGIMVIDPHEVVIEVNDKPIELFLPDGMFKEDGSMRTSKRLFNKIHKVSGTHGYVIKSVIRYLNNDTFDDYVNFKMLETMAVSGTKIYKINNNIKELIAEYNGYVWKDSNGVEFDRLATTEEMKQSSGKFSPEKNGLYVIHTIPEESTRILQVHGDSRQSAAFPINAFELSAYSGFGSDKESVEFNLYKAVGKWYDHLSDRYLDKLYSFRPKIDIDKNIEDMTKDELALVQKEIDKAASELLLFLYKELQEGELPSELDYYIRTDKSGGILYTSNLIKQITPMLTNWFLYNGLYKGRNPSGGSGTLLHIKPGTHLDVKPGEYIASLDNNVIRNNLIMLINESDDTDTINRINILRHNGIKTEEDYANLENAINNWLKSYSVEVVVHRQPIPNTTSVKIGTISGVVGGYGEVVFASPEDVAWLHEGDYDGDELHIEFVGQNLIDAIKKYNESDEFKKREKRYPLSIFKEKHSETKLESQRDRFRVLSNNAKTNGAQGNVVGAKTILATMAYKDVEFTLPNGSVFKVYDPLGTTTLDYLPILDNEIETAKKLAVKYGDEIVKINNKHYLKTTKETEFTILLQASVDEWKYGIISGIDFGLYKNLTTWLLTRMFYNTNGSDIKVRTNKYEGDIVHLFAVRRLFNYSKDRRGVSSNGKTRTLAGSIQRSREIASSYFDESGDRRVNANVISNSLLSMLKTDWNSRNPKIKSIVKLSVNNKISPVEKILSALELKDLYETKKHYDKVGITSPNPFIFYPNDHKYAHAMTIREMFNDFGNELFTNYEKNDPKEFSKIYQFTKTMVKEFMDLHAEHEKGMSVRARLDPERGSVRYEFSEEFAKFIDKHKPGFDKLSNKDVSTLIFLYGINYKGYSTHSVLKLLPAQLMSKKIISEYGSRYAKYLFTKSANKGRNIRTNEMRIGGISDILNRIRSIKHCG